MDSFDVFSENFRKFIENGVKNLNLVDVEEKPGNYAEKHTWDNQNGKNMSCSYCRVNFDDIPTQREHYKLDWHRFNLKQSLLQKAPITECEFEVKNENDDISSLSGSESEQEGLDTFVNAKGKIFLKNNSGRIISLYKCVLQSKKEEICDEMLEKLIKQSCFANKQWAVFLLGGGHFAGAIFKDGEPVLHKTFHCYTVRQGQGGSQKNRDAKSGSSHPKSAGASLRRYNEQALIQHVQGILEQWDEEIRGCSLIFYRASGPYNRSVLFSGNGKILDKYDERLRVIPFSTRRATFKEVQRVHITLASVNVYANFEQVMKQFKMENTKRTRVRSPQINRAKSRELPERVLPTKHSSETCSLASESSSDEPPTFQTEDTELHFEHLRQYSNTKVPKTRKKKNKQRDDEDVKKRNELIEILTRGDLRSFIEIYEAEDSEKGAFLNRILDKDGNTCLHLAATNERLDFLEFLLEKGCDPCGKNKQLQTPYCCTQSKPVRALMKNFAAEHPEMYNYNKANIPTTTLTESEQELKKKQAKLAKREKEKAKRREKKEQQAEEAEKQRFLNLSDREKRALAAERRILSKNAAIITSRCFLCASDISGAVPFEYSDYRFCSIECLKAHKLQRR